MAEEQRVPKLSDLPEIGDLSLPGQEPKKPVSPEAIVEIVGILPEELRGPTLDFMTNIVKSIIVQQTSMEGEEAKVSVTPNQTEFYKKRFEEILNSGLLNPRVNLAKKISE